MFRICVDIGGTFTDLVLMDNLGKISEFKVPTTPWDFSEGVINAMTDAADAFHEPLASFMGQIGVIVHGTTVATNALVTRKIAKTAMITTEGFRDIIEMRCALKIETKSMYDAFIPPYEPIVPRFLRFPVREETHYTGEIKESVDEDEIRKIIAKIKLEGIEAIAVCFINSYANPGNERRVAQICREELEDVFITCSSDILPKMGEYERESTCVINACVGPIVSYYLSSLEKKLHGAGFTGQLLIMQANQFTQTVTAIREKPVYLMDSGPAAAPAGAAYLGSIINEPNIITADMGGTTLDAAVVLNNEVILTASKWFNDDKIGIKVADVSSIGTGGGSIAWFDSLGLLRVGPQSAGADPGPASYDRGGTEPTVTDAAVVLGYLPTDFFCGGKVPLNKQRAREAMEKVAFKMDSSIEETAQAIFFTSNSNMANEISRISTRKGYDTRDFSLLACGGGGAMCGAFWGKILTCKNVIIPNYPSSFCAWSMFALAIGRDYLHPYISQLSAAKPGEINSLYHEMLSDALSELEAFNVTREDIIITKSIDLLYQEQYHEVEMEIPDREIVQNDLDELESDFHQKHKELYTFDLSWVPIEIRNLRLIARLKREKLDLLKIPEGSADPSKAFKRTRPCFFEGEFVETTVYDSELLRAGNVINGPAIIEVPTTTAVIPKDFQCRVDDYNNYIMTRKS